jgi:hypothetical protein
MRYAADAIACEEVVYIGTDPSGARD